MKENTTLVILETFLRDIICAYKLDLKNAKKHHNKNVEFIARAKLDAYELVLSFIKPVKQRKLKWLKLF